MKSLTAVRKKIPKYPVEFKIKMVEISAKNYLKRILSRHGFGKQILELGVLFLKRLQAF
jgi:transposase